MLYQFDRPFVIDAEETTEVFGLRATPLDAQIAATIESYRDGQIAGTMSSSESESASLGTEPRLFAFLSTPSRGRGTEV